MLWGRQTLRALGIIVGRLMEKMLDLKSLDGLRPEIVVSSEVRRWGNVLLPIADLIDLRPDRLL